MSNYKTKNNGIRFMFFLILFGFVAIHITKNVRGNTFENKHFSVEDTANECSSCKPSEEKIVNENNSYIIYDLTEEETIDISEYVLGSSSKGGVSSMCDPAANKVDLLRRLCQSSGVDIHHEDPKRGKVIGSSGGSIDTEKINGFRLTKVTYPLAFWLGQYVHQTSNKEISVGHPEYTSNGQSIPGGEEFQLKTLYPQQAEDVEKALSTTERQPFEVTGNLNVGADEQLESKDGVYNVENADHDPICGCPREVSTSDYNVGATNYLSDQGGGYWRQQIPGGNPAMSDIEKKCINKSDIKGVDFGLWTACTTNTLASFFKGLFNFSFSADRWDYCDESGKVVCDENGENCTTERKECIDPRDITVYMTPIFGEPFKCENGVCTNAFLTNTYMATLNPQQSDGKQEVSDSNDDSLMYFRSTPCEGVLEFEDKTEEKELKNLRCLWDATPTLFNYKLQAKDKAPDYSIQNFPLNFERHEADIEVYMKESANQYGLL